jgi:hypothetical protein
MLRRVSPDGARVLVVGPRSYAGGAVAQDLRAAGFDVEVLDRRDALAAARVRQPAAVVAFDGPGNGWIREAGHDPALASIPVVGATALDPARPRFVPFLTPVRWDAVLRSGEQHQAGVPARRVREAIAGGPRRPVKRGETLGAWLCTAGSVLTVLGFAVLFWDLAAVARGAAARTVAWMIPYTAGMVSGDLGVRLAVGQRPRLRWWTWVLAVLSATLLAAAWLVRS